jgi:hypothetical protein
MSRHRFLIVLAVIAIPAFAIALRAQDNAAPAAAELTGKVVTFNLDSELGGVVKDSSVVSIGGRSFLSGTGVDMGSNDWRNGLRVLIPIENVIQLVEYESIEEARKAYATAFQRPEAPTRQRSNRQPKDGL